MQKPPTGTFSTNDVFVY